MFFLFLKTLLIFMIDDFGGKETEKLLEEDTIFFEVEQKLFFKQQSTQKKIISKSKNKTHMYRIFIYLPL